MTDTIRNTPRVKNEGTGAFSVEPMVSCAWPGQEKWSYFNTSLPQVQVFRIEHHGHEKESLFIRALKRLKEEYAETKDYFENTSFNELKSLTEKIVGNLLELTPRTLGVELTYEESIFYTIGFDDKNVYLEVLLEDEKPELLASVFQDKERIFRREGAVDDVLADLKQTFESGFQPVPTDITNGKYGALSEPFASPTAL